jgi:hypothetical protein
MRACSVSLATEETMIQLPGDAIRLKVRVLRAEFDRDDVLRSLRCAIRNC